MFIRSGGTRAGFGVLWLVTAVGQVIYRGVRLRLSNRERDGRDADNEDQR
jgi:hypothetical protein